MPCGITHCYLPPGSGVIIGMRTLDPRVRRPNQLNQPLDHRATRWSICVYHIDWHVSGKSTKIHSCFLLIPKAKWDNCLSEPFGLSITITRRPWVYSVHYLSMTIYTSVHGVIMVIRILSSGPMKLIPTSCFIEKFVSYFIAWNIEVSRDPN